MVPLHCTGLEARGWLRERLGEGCVLGGVGVRGVFGGGTWGGGGGAGRRVQDCRLGLQNIKHQDFSFIHNILLAFGFDFR